MLPIPLSKWLTVQNADFSHGMLARYMSYFDVVEEMKWADASMPAWKLQALSKSSLPTNTVVANIDTLVNHIDEALEARSVNPYAHNPPPRSRSCDQLQKKFWEYPNHTDSEWKNKVTWGSNDLWANYSEALTALTALAEASGLGTQLGGLVNPGNHQLRFPRIAFSLLRKPSSNVKFPAHLKRLMRDIYWSWKQAGCLDERTAADQNAKRVVNTPGSLRSWHMNQKGILKNIKEDALPQASQAFHTHYKDTSPLENNVLQNVGQAQAPIGYAEYTGTGIQDDVHYCKMVLDYKNDLFYLCVTHYQFWVQEGQGHTLKGQTYEEGCQPPWFCIDFHR